MKKFIIFIAFLLSAISVYAQIGYQVSLLNTATGEPRANEKVTAKIELSNSDGEVVYSETQTGVTNDFGVLSLTIGNAQSLSAIDWSKYPMFISVTVDNVLIGKTQVMSVPYANAVVPLSMDIIAGMWIGTSTYKYRDYSSSSTYTFTFTKDGNYTLKLNGSSKDDYTESGFYIVSLNDIYCFYPSTGDEEDIYINDYNCRILKYIDGKIYFTSKGGPSLTKQ